jgi:hypothetical protein
MFKWIKKMRRVENESLSLIACIHNETIYYYYLAFNWVSPVYLIYIFLIIIIILNKYLIFSTQDILKIYISL